MKVICAGPVKSGTKSLNAALSKLGYDVYDFAEQFYYQHEYWENIYNGKATTEDFRKMYKNVDAVMDMPAYHFWKEILEAFPDAKVILAVRDSEEAWYCSLLNHMKRLRQERMFFIKLHCTPLGRKWAKHIYTSDMLLFGMNTFSIFAKPLNEIVHRQHYRKQIADVMQNTPTDQLLVFNCKEGWKPLCDFLNVPVPSTPFPRQNTASNRFVEDFVEAHPLYKEMDRQFKWICAITVLASCSVGIFGAYKYLKIF